MLLEMRDGREEFRRLPPDEAIRRCQVVRGRRRGRQCRAQAEAASCRPPPAAEAATHRPPRSATNCVPGGYLSEDWSDECEMDMSQPEGMEELPDLAFVGRIRERSPVTSLSSAAPLRPSSVPATPLLSPCQTTAATATSSLVAPEAGARELVDAACDARPLTPPPPPLPPQIIHVVNDSDLERPLMTPREMAAAVAAIMTAVPTASPSAVADRLCNTLGDLVPAPQRQMIDLSVRFAAELHRELCESLFRDFEATFGQLEYMNDNTVRAMLRYLFETLVAWHGRPSLRNV